MNWFKTIVISVGAFISSVFGGNSQIINDVITPPESTSTEVVKVVDNDLVRSTSTSVIKHYYESNTKLNSSVSVDTNTQKKNIVTDKPVITRPVTVTTSVVVPKVQSNISVTSPKQGDIWYQNNAYTISWTPAQGDFDEYAVMLSNKIVTGTMGGCPVYVPVSKNSTSISFNPQDLSENCIQAWVSNATNQGISTTEQAIRNNFFFTIYAEKNTDNGKSKIISSGTGPVFSILSSVNSPVQSSSMSIISPKQGDTFVPGNSIPITWGGSWSGNDSFIIEWSNAVTGEKGGPIITGLTQAQAGCSGYGKSVCGYSWTPTYQTGQIKISLYRNTGSDKGIPEKITSGSFAVTSNSRTEPPAVVVYCPYSFTCTPTSSQYPPIPSASGPSVGGSCPTGYNCYSTATVVPTPSRIQITVPNGGEVYYTGHPITVKFNSNVSQPADVLLEGYNGGSLTGRQYSFGVAKDRDNFGVLPAGSTEFTFIPTGYMLAQLGAENGGTFKIRVMQQSDNFYYTEDYTDSAFQILPDPTPPPPTPLPITPVSPMPCPQSVSVNGIEYSLNPCTINLTMIHGQGNKDFSATITGGAGFSFNISGYGEGFPTYGIIADTSSGASVGTQGLLFHLNDNYLLPNGYSPMTYSGYVPINISPLDQVGGGKTLYLNVNVVVSPATR